MAVKTIVIVGLIGVSIGMGVVLGVQMASHSPSSEALTFSHAPAKESSPTATPEVALPQQLTIPKLNISADIEHVGLDEKRNMDVPKDVNNVAWYNKGPTPGQVGNAVLAGHLDSETGPAVFYRLNELNPGDEVEVVKSDEERVVFRVTHKEQYTVDDFPLEEVFGGASTSRLNLITCTGSFDEASRNYSHRTVVYTKLAEG